MTRQNQLLKAAQNRILVLDGAMGTQIQDLNLSEIDFGGAQYEGCNEYLCITRPEIILKIHEDYLLAGADIIETNTFGSTPLVLAEYGLGELAYDLSRKAAELARKACTVHSTPDKPRFVAGSIGPTTKSISVTGGIQFQELVENFLIQSRGLLDGGADYLLIETAQDSRNIKAALIAIEKLEKETKQEILIAISGTVETMGTLLAGQTVDAFLTSFLHKKLLYIGLNCATGPEFMTDHIRTLAQMSPFPVACVPNAGLPDEDGTYLESPSMMAKVLSQFIDNGWLNFIGGCCGTSPEHIRRFSEIAKNRTPRKNQELKTSLLSGLECLEITEEMRPIIVAERTNVIGSKKFRELIADGKFEEAADIGRAQIKSGAHVIDVCLSNPDRNEFADAQLFYEKLIKVTKSPLMIDTTDEKVTELCLQYCQGKSLINSINLEDGEERFEKVVPLAKSYGAALVVGTIDEDPDNGMATTVKRKLEVAQRSFDILTKKYQIPPEDIYFDPLVFPCATGDEKYIGSAAETIEGLREIKKHFPRCKSVLGISNVSFGLPTSGREVLNTVFLHHCILAGLDLAMVNSEKLERFSSISPEEIELANNLLFNRGPDPIAKFVAKFRDVKTKQKTNRLEFPLDERLSRNIVEGSKEGLIEDLNEALKTSEPMKIINGPLMKGMDEVGKLFNDNKLIVAEVLQSAEVMKTAVSHLESFMKKSDRQSRGKLVLATVKGDVHDIGKNLVDIIFSNNGYEVINLGIKVPPDRLIAAVNEHRPDYIGLSGLLVKSAQQMIATAEDLSSAGIKIPMLVGGAALSRGFTEKRISTAYLGSVFYASDAMNGLDIANQLRDPVKSVELILENQKRKQQIISETMIGNATPNIANVVSVKRSPTVQTVDHPPQPPDYNPHVIKNISLNVIWKMINPLMLFGRHLGVKGSSAKLLGETTLDLQTIRYLKDSDPKALEIHSAVCEVMQFALNTPELYRPSGIYQFFKAKSDGQNTNIVSSNGEILTSFSFPRQPKEPWLCISDYINPSDMKSETEDNLCLFVVTAGNQVREYADKFKAKGECLKSHIVQALALETAEAFAEHLHSMIRTQWGFPDSPNMTNMERFQAKYVGKRYSFGYPACPRLEDQELLFKILQPEKIGVELTSGCMMEPEASVSAIVFHHPEAKYFSVGNSDAAI
jgi:5-methyltetrahydrofolate--homocysteine methyltransferase